MKKIAHCIHHTHWDLIWYFTAQDAMVQFSYNMKEMIRGFQENRIQHFFLDGQVQPIEEYLQLHPEDRDYISELISSNKLEIGPFHSQLDCFISSGESVINNLRLGIKIANEIGGSSKIAYLPDSFGHSADFPKIFNQFGIKEFVITRGVGDEYDLGSEFIMESNDGSQLLTYVMIAGYGYGCYPFKNGTLLDKSAEDYNKISVHQLIDRLLSYSTLDNEFVFPLGFDQNPVMLDIPKRIAEYNQKSSDYEFKLTTWKDFFHHVRENTKGLKVHKGELFSTQYHRVHRSIFSARADIKGLQDKCERILTYEVQPLMSMMDSIGIEYDHGLIDKAWKTLITCQTHSSANLTDATNNYIENETRNAIAMAQATKTYLLKVVSLSLPFQEDNAYPLVIANTTIKRNTNVIEAKVFSKTKQFTLTQDNQIIPYVIKKSVQKNHGVLRKDKALLDESKYYYETDIIFEVDNFSGIQYCTLVIHDDKQSPIEVMDESVNFIENEYYRIYMDVDGITIYDKKNDVYHHKAIYLEDMGDEGDSFDYSYPDNDMRICEYMQHSYVRYSGSSLLHKMKVEGEFEIPYGLKERERKECNSTIQYSMEICLKKGSPLIELKGYIDNAVNQHRVRLVISGHQDNKYSYAGTQFGYIKRETNPKELKIWKEQNWFEEPSPTFPLLNYVSAVCDYQTITVYTKSSKEYEFIGNGKKDIAVTLLRAYGALGFPDLNRRPGRPSGLDYRIFYTEDTQMKKKNNFELAISYDTSFDGNIMHNRYIAYATEKTYYQKQDFDKSIELISYFPTNPIEKKIPWAYHFIDFKDFDGSISTIVKADNNQGYLVRMFNNENYGIQGGKLITKCKDFELSEVNLEEKEITTLKENLPNLKPGQYKNLMLKS
ncbi:MAG: glycoside hydrolase family 38 C-terminal domain-containing protein [Longibaculum sp.]